MRRPKRAQASLGGKDPRAVRGNAVRLALPRPTCAARCSRPPVFLGFVLCAAAGSGACMRKRQPNPLTGDGKIVQGTRLLQCARCSNKGHSGAVCSCRGPITHAAAAVLCATNGRAACAGLPAVPTLTAAAAGASRGAGGASSSPGQDILRALGFGFGLRRAARHQQPRPAPFPGGCNLAPARPPVRKRLPRHRE